MQNILSLKFNLIVLLSFMMLFTGGCKWLDGDGHELPSGSNGLASISVSEGSLSPAFNIGSNAYSVDVENTVESIQVTATLDHTRASFTINGVATKSGTASAPIRLAVGSNIILIVVTAENGVLRTITITVTRAQPVALSSNADLSVLAISVGDLVPVFDSQTINYGVSVANTVDSLTVTPTTDDANATILVNSTAVDSGSSSGAIALSVGDTTINVLVTAEDGSTEKAYTVTVTRDDPLSANADLSGLTLSSGSLAPTFASSTFDYTASVAFETTSITVTPVLSDTNATVAVNGAATASGSASTAIDLSEGVNTITLMVLAEDGVASQTYTITVTRQAAASFAQEAYIKASNTESNDRFGESVALFGDTLAVGAGYEDSNATGEGDNSVSGAGAVYVFVRDNAGTWIQQAYIKASNPGSSDNFGYSVALSGDTLAVGAWLEDSGDSGIDGDQNDNSLSDAGAVYVFTRASGVWSQQAYIKASNPGAADQFGVSVALSGDTLAVGARREESADTGINGNELDNSFTSGAVYVFTRTANIWSQQAYIKASNTGADDLFGNNVDLSGDTLAVTAHMEDSNAVGINNNQVDNSASGSGAVYVFTRTANVWSQQAYIKASNAEAQDRLGQWGVALSGDTLAVAARGESSNSTGINGIEGDNSASGSGAVYVFTRTANVWSQQAYIKASNAEAGDGFGSSIAIHGDAMAVGAEAEDSSVTGIDGDQANNSAGGSGAAYFFTRSAGVWSQQNYIKPATVDLRDEGEFGNSIALYGTILVVGEKGEDSNATGINGDQGDNSASGSGAVHVFKTP